MSGAVRCTKYLIPGPGMLFGARYVNNVDLSGFGHLSRKKSGPYTLAPSSKVQKFVLPRSKTGTRTTGGTFSCIKKMTSGARERELATFDENRRAVGMLNPMRDKI